MTLVLCSLHHLMISRLSLTSAVCRLISCSGSSSRIQGAKGSRDCPGASSGIATRPRKPPISSLSFPSTKQLRRKQQTLAGCATRASSYNAAEAQGGDGQQSFRVRCSRTPEIARSKLLDMAATHTDNNRHRAARLCCDRPLGPLPPSRPARMCHVPDEPNICRVEGL